MSELTSRQIQAKHTKKQILTAASTLLKHKTLDAISIQEICKSAHVSVGAFYHHFENKAGIIIELYKDIDLIFENTILPSMDTAHPLEAIIEYLIQQCLCADRYGLDMVQNAYKAQINNGNLFFLSNDRGLPHGLKTLVSLAKENHLLKEDTSVEMLTSELLIISRGIIYHWCVNNGQTDMPETVRKIIGNYLRAYIS